MGLNRPTFLFVPFKPCNKYSPPLTGADKDQPAGQQDLLGPGHLKDPHLGGQQHHLLLGARWACQFAEPAICILLDKLKYTQLQTRNTKLFIWSTLLLTKSTSGSRSPAGEGRLEMTHKVRIVHINCWQLIKWHQRNNELTEPKRLASDGTRDDEHSATARFKQQWGRRSK